MGDRLVTIDLGWKVGGCCAVLFSVERGGARSPSKTMSPGPRPYTSTSSGILIHLTFGHNTPTLQTDRQRCNSIGRTNRFYKRSPGIKSQIYLHRSSRNKWCWNVDKLDILKCLWFLSGLNVGAYIHWPSETRQIEKKLHFPAVIDQLHVFAGFRADTMEKRRAPCGLQEVLNRLAFVALSNKPVCFYKCFAEALERDVIHRTLLEIQAEQCKFHFIFLSYATY